MLQEQFDKSRLQTLELIINAWAKYRDERSAHQAANDSADDFLTAILKRRSALYRSQESEDRGGFSHLYIEFLCARFEVATQTYARSPAPMDQFVKHKLEGINALCIQHGLITDGRVASPSNADEMHRLATLLGKYIAMLDALKRIDVETRPRLTAIDDEFMKATLASLPPFYTHAWCVRAFDQTMSKGRIKPKEQPTQLDLTDDPQRLTAKQTVLILITLLEANPVVINELQQSQVTRFISRVTGIKEGTLKAHVRWMYDRRSRVSSTKKGQETDALKQDLSEARKTLGWIGLDLDESMARMLDQILSSAEMG